MVLRCAHFGRVRAPLQLYNISIFIQFLLLFEEYPALSHLFDHWFIQVLTRTMFT